jgi:hypothetical protein
MAGTATLQAAPGGMSEIVRRTGLSTLGSTGGLTQTRSAAAFSPPVFRTRNAAERRGTTVEHFAEVERTAARDATHECFYPGAGDHLRPGMTQQIGGGTFTHYWRVSPQMSALIRQGEEEHLADAARAFALTYQLVADTINALVGRRFGPASTPAAAQAIAEAELARRIPAALGVDPARWVSVLDRLLLQTKSRDQQGWHAVATGPPVTEGTRIVHPLMTVPGTRIGTVPSSQVVNY